MSFEADVGMRLRNIRESRNLSRRDVQNLTKDEFKESILAMYENGQRRIATPRLKRLADFYQVPMTYFVGEVSSGGQGSRDYSVEAALKSDPEFSDEERELLLHVINVIKAKREVERGK
jgi:transcriptional regulator with XRE-family HTH domain